MINNNFSHFFMCFVFTLILEFVLYYIIKKLKIYDHPNIRKLHDIPKLTIGGIMFIIPYTIFGGWRLISGDIFSILAFSCVIFSGIFDDIKGMSPKYKLLGQLLASVLVFFSGVRFYSFLGSENIFLMFILTVFYYISFINIINLIDGADGLAVVICVIISTGILMLNGMGMFFMPIFLLIMALLVFLMFNLKNSLIFMGDCGSNFLGFFIAYIMLRTGFDHLNMTRILPFLLIIFIPFFDTFLAIIRRKLNKKSIFHADKEHIHHILIARFGLNRTLIILGIIQFMFTFAGVYLYRMYI